MHPRQSIEPEAGTNTEEESREQAAGSIADALDYLRGEAAAAGLDDVAVLVRRASRRARSALPAADFYKLCREIDRLPEACRAALVLRKVYRRSCAEIAGDCGISEAAAKARIMEGFRLLLAATADAAGKEPVEALVER